MLPTREVDKLIDSLVKCTGKAEVEVRFHKYHGYPHSKSLSIQSFSQLRDSLKEKLTCEVYESSSNGPIRRKTSKSDGKVTWMRKDANIYVYDHHNLPIRYSLSSESVIEKAPLNFRPIHTRNIVRYSCLMCDGLLRLDMSQVKCNSSSTVDYEVELELLGEVTTDNIRTVGVVTMSLISKLYETDNIYHKEEYELVVSYINKGLSFDKTKLRRTIDTECIYQSRNLHVEDLRDGGLFSSDESLSPSRYVVSTKADGVRKLLVYHQVFGTMLISPPDNVNIISRKIPPGTGGYVLDVEMIPLTKRVVGVSSSSKYWLLVFDCLYTNKNNKTSDCRHLTYEERMNEAKKCVLLQEKTDMIDLGLKPFFAFRSLKEMFVAVEEASTLCLNAPYETDGLIFTSGDMKYNSGNDDPSKELSKRRLYLCEDVCKWKPTEHLTIDFCVRWALTEKCTRRLEIYTGERGGELSKFKGSMANPHCGYISGKHVASSMLCSVEMDAIVEFRYDALSAQLIPTRLRNDKNRPNRTQNALDTWDLIHQSISLDVLTGKSCLFMRRYHNDIKRKLYGEALKYNESKRQGDISVLLDVGSGQGGSLSKTRMFDVVVNVEPSTTQNEEYMRRAKAMGIECHVIRTGDDISLLNPLIKKSSNQHYIIESSILDIIYIKKVLDKLVGGKVDVVSSLLCLGYLWKSKEDVDSFSSLVVSVLGAGGSFIYMTLDGDLLQHHFIPPWTDVDNEYYSSTLQNTYSFGSLSFNHSSREVSIDLKDTRVSNQLEYTVKMDDLTYRFEKGGLELIKRERANDCHSLSEEELFLSGLFSYGIYSKRGKATSGILSTKTSGVTKRPR